MSDEVAVVSQRVLGLERGHNELRDEVRGVETEMRRGFKAVDEKIATGFADLSSKMDIKATPQWQAYGVIAMVLIPICGALIWPIREQGSRNESTNDKLIEKVLKLTHDLEFIDGQLHPFQKGPSQ